MKLVLAALIAVAGCKGGKADPANVAAAETAKTREVAMDLSKAVDALEADHAIMLDAVGAVANAKDDASRARAIEMLAPHELIEAHDFSSVGFEVGKVMAQVAPDAAHDLAAQADTLIAARKDSEAKFKTALAAAASDPIAAQKAQRDFEEAQYRAARAEGARKP
ncbi:MAG TPA: hypothetical protein VGG28_05850 [Kofleriaceae bacterium]